MLLLLFFTFSMHVNMKLELVQENKRSFTFAFNKILSLVILELLKL